MLKVRLKQQVQVQWHEHTAKIVKSYKMIKALLVNTEGEYTRHGATRAALVPKWHHNTTHGRSDTGPGSSDNTAREPPREAVVGEKLTDQRESRLRPHDHHGLSAAHSSTSAFSFIARIPSQPAAETSATPHGRSAPPPQPLQYSNRTQLPP